MPLYGKGVDNINLWGVVDPSLTHFPSFNSALRSSGAIGANKNIKKLANVDGNIFEVRPKNLKNRALGVLKTGEQALVDTLNSIITLEQTNEVVRQVIVYGADKIGIVYFSKQTRSHTDISEVALSL